MGEGLREIGLRIALAEGQQRDHRRAERFIEAAASEIRIQALREASAIIEGRPLPPNMMRQSRGARWSHAG